MPQWRGRCALRSSDIIYSLAAVGSGRVAAGGSDGAIQVLLPTSIAATTQDVTTPSSSLSIASCLRKPAMLPSLRSSASGFEFSPVCAQVLRLMADGDGGSQLPGPQPLRAPDVW